MINLPSTSRTSLPPLTAVWKDAVQRPVERSHVRTTPAASLEIAISSLVCRLMDVIGIWGSGVEFGSEGIGAGSGSTTAVSIDKVPICQNLTVLSIDAEMRDEGEENVREVIAPVCPTRVSTG